MELTRGDTGQFKFQRKDAEGHVILTTPDALYKNGAIRIWTNN